MSISSVKQQFKQEDLPLEVVEFDTSTATVELAAQALGVEPARIAKTMAIQLKDRNILLLAKGDVKLDNRKFKDTFLEKAKFMKPDQVMAITGHPVGGVCPFGLKNALPIYLDESLKIFDYVYPAGGGANTAVKIQVDDLADLTQATWVDVCKET
jgi:Cys-tRNA(Pro) deacylase